MANLAAACRRCAAGDWPYAPNGGVERCDCLRGRQLLYIAECRGRRRDDVPGVTEVQAALAIEELAVMMPFVPDGDIAHALLARELMRFVCDAEELAWLVRQLVLGYAKWPGINSKLHRVIALHPAEIIGKLKRIAHLRQFAFPAIANVEAAADINDR